MRQVGKEAACSSPYMKRPRRDRGTPGGVYTRKRGWLRTPPREAVKKKMMKKSGRMARRQKRLARVWSGQFCRFRCEVGRVCQLGVELFIKRDGER